MRTGRSPGHFWAAVIIVAAIAAAGVMPVLAVAPANEHFERAWARTDKPVADNQVSRTWMWGPEAFTGAIEEDYTEAPAGKRTVQYFDKSRMEITDPSEPDTDSAWYKYHVTNGLLAMELVSGQMQVGHNDFVNHGPARVNVAGDSDDPTGPTYATFTSLATPNHIAMSRVGEIVTERVARDSTVTDDPSLAGRGISIAFFDDVTSHNVAQPFWAFMNASGVVWDWRNNAFVTAMLNDDPAFPQGDPYYAVGRPVTEPYWANVKVANTYRDVLMQCFERRCLTYTADNPEGWQVEAGNIGQHYYTWRYDQGEEPDPNAVPERGALIDTINNYLDVIEDSEGDGWAQYVVGDALHHYVESNDFGTFTPSDDSYEDVIVTVDVRFISENEISASCLVTRMSPDESVYSLCLYADGYVEAAYEHIVDGWFEIEPLTGPPPDTVKVNPVSEWNNLEIIAKGNQLWFLVNGDLLGTVTHDALKSGPIAIFTWRSGDANPVEVAYRNLSQYEVK